MAAESNFLCNSPGHDIGITVLECGLPLVNVP